MDMNEVVPDKDKDGAPVMDAVVKTEVQKINILILNVLDPFGQPVVMVGSDHSIHTYCQYVRLLYNIKQSIYSSLLGTSWLDHG